VTDSRLGSSGIAAAAFDALLARGGDHVLLVVDDRLRILRASAEIVTLAGRSEGAIEGMSLIAALGSARLDAVARAALAAGGPMSGEVELGRSGERQFDVDAIPLPDGGLVLALHDVTTMRRMERVRRDFVANISHELRTPLASIKLLAETLGAGATGDQATATEFASQIEREADHLAQLVDELLDLSMIESGAVRLEMEPLDPDVVIADVAERIGPVAERREIALRVQPPGGDAASRGATAWGDAGRLSQALLNLAHNAVKYSNPGGEVRIGWQVRGDRVRFSVADDGIGVPASHQARIFERFYKVDRSRARGEGAATKGTESGSAGLGLAIVRHIAEAHAGAVGMESVEGSGSTFWIEVPLAG
jgi:two-component system phosphate regulon sensor histidine kinase PhoR